MQRIQARPILGPLMVQGTMSNAGKSIVAAGLCRIFSQDGYRVAPFKSQNMALNSFITEAGGEMGRAQVVQAQAAGIEPETDMNPVLLKPTTDQGSQVIVNGAPVGTMSAVQYYAFKKNLIPDIEKAYSRLCRDRDIIVIEGAGSPAEINLKDDDIVNMGIAQMTGAPVLLVADIDRGGVFASIYGTLMLLESEERAFVKGIIINKFRGDLSILKPGLDMIENLTGVPVIGVIPWLNIDIDDEDSLSARLDRKAPAVIDIAVIRLPRMSNFTDFNAFDLIEGTVVRYVDSVKDLREPDLLIVPGSKNTIADLLWMRQCGLEAAVLHRARSGTPVIGICGGYQILGKKLSDPCGVEAGGVVDGMGLLNAEATFETRKRTVQVSGRFARVEGIFSALSGMPFEGYEIHCGISSVKGKALTDIAVSGGEDVAMKDGAQTLDGNVQAYGTYVHGLFDNDGIAATIVKALLQRKGLADDIKTVDVKTWRNCQYDILAAALRRSLNMDAVMKIIRTGM